MDCLAFVGLNRKTYGIEPLIYSTEFFPHLICAFMKKDKKKKSGSQLIISACSKVYGCDWNCSYVRILNDAQA